MYRHSDPTAAKAIGAADRDWRHMIALAYRYRTDPAMASKIPKPQTVFTGSFGRLLTDPIEELQAAVSRQ